MRLIVIGLLLALSACGNDVVDEDDGYVPVPWTGDGHHVDDAPDAPAVDDDPVDDEGPVDEGPVDEEPVDEPPPPPDPDNWPAGWSEREVRMLELVNEMRTNGGDCPSGHYGPRSPLVMNPALRTAARLHSKDMADQNYFDHNGLDGSDPWRRMADAGYDAQPVGENIAAGNAAAEDAFDQWVNSDGHCRNMMSSNATEIGVGMAQNDASQFGAYWTQTFGAR